MKAARILFFVVLLSGGLVAGALAGVETSHPPGIGSSHALAQPVVVTAAQNSEARLMGESPLAASCAALASNIPRPVCLHRASASVQIRQQRHPGWLETWLQCSHLLPTPEWQTSSPARVDVSSGQLAVLEGDCTLIPSHACTVVLPPEGQGTLESRIEAILAQAPEGTWGVYVKNLVTGQVVSINGEQALHPASTIKVAIAIGLFVWLDDHPSVELSNGPRPGRNYEQLLRALLVQSEELAASTLEEFLESKPGYELTPMVRGWGAEDSSVTPRRSTPADLALLFERLYRGDLLSESSNAFVLELLRTPSRGDDERIGAVLSECARRWVAHKPGTTYEAGIDVIGDVGLVQIGDTAFVIAVIGNHVAWIDYDEAEQTIADIAEAVLSVFLRDPGAVMVPVIVPAGPSPR
ncbi:MAG: serine hydrolase [Anaerolineales bacterium]|jgi:beta-lactamase class A